MKILIVGLNFFPTLIGTGKFTSELAEFLAANGHEIRAITAPPFYPHWRIAEGYHGWRYSRENWKGIQITRCPLWVPKHPGGVKRLIHLLTFGLSSIPALISQIRWKPDAILCIAPTLMSAPGALALANLCAAKKFLHVQDFELDAATNLGLLSKGNWLSKIARWIERAIFSRFDIISTISGKMIDKLITKGVPPEKCKLLPNWVDTDQIFPLDDPNPLRIELNLPENKLVLLYSGNLGYKQGLEVITEAAKILGSNKDLFFLISGDGAARDDLKKNAEGLTNLKFIPIQPLEKLNLLLNLADIHLLPQRAGAADLVFPSKLTGMLASGKAVIATAEPGTELGRVIQETGVLAPPEDPEALAKAILQLAKNPEKRRVLGEKSRAYAAAIWHKDKVLSDFIRMFDHQE